ncbi:MAG: putative hydroxymethylpyrimidine transporter CytX [Nitrososphaerota archaeon]|nr:putative hydroxymethylpyrimidine transporter CytX [Nitrososphaerales archaeon]MCX8191892.1 putative hydroxymethylpyrimidine transporter CytX [Nitrososphaerales archaeon]MDW8044867.1 putative hydroxymethylpyrimidine transporter CytX [Nitrososphaerota archaeon]
MKIRFPPEWGIEPVSKDYRYLRFIDYFILWTSLGKGLLVFWAGSLLVPQLSLNAALLIIIVGSIIGSLPLALVGVMGSDNAIPTMVVLRPSFGIYGSYLPSILNIIQLVGWTVFEIVVMALAANNISKSAFGYSNFYLWVIIFTTFCVLMGIVGPIAVVREWLEKFAFWILYGSTVWIAYSALTTRNFLDLIALPAQGDLPLLLAMDIVIAMPISWMPLIADYNRFARNSKEGFWGTFIGYIIANVIGYGVGAILILSMGTTDVVSAIMLVHLGAFALVLILIYEVDNGFADLYSAAVSIQNLFPRLKQRLLIITLGILSAILAMLIGEKVYHYEWFLLWIGSVFVPVFGVAFVDYFLVKNRRYDLEMLYGLKGAYKYRGGINIRAIVAWSTGVLIYYSIVWYIPWLGASIPSLLTSAFTYWILSGLSNKR